MGTRSEVSATDYEDYRPVGCDPVQSDINSATFHGKPAATILYQTIGGHVTEESYIQ